MDENQQGDMPKTDAPKPEGQCKTEGNCKTDGAKPEGSCKTEGDKPASEPAM